MFTLLPYTLATGGAVTDADMGFVSDAEFTGRAGHLLLTEDYQLLAAYTGGATVTRANLQVPLFNMYSRFNFWPINRSITVPSPPLVQWFEASQILLPRYEEITIKVSDTALEQATVFLWLCKAPFTRNLPPSQIPFPLVARATCAPTIVANGWSGLAALTFEQTLKGGTYSVVGATLQGTNVQAFRLVFPRSFVMGTRKMRPGWLANQALGDQDEVHVRENPYFLGEWGRFWTVELPQVEVYGTAVATPTCEVRLWLIKLSDTDAGLP